jgi:hypothetical protein
LQENCVRNNLTRAHPKLSATENSQIPNGNDS